MVLDKTWIRGVGGVGGSRLAMPENTAAAGFLLKSSPPTTHQLN